MDTEATPFISARECDALNDENVTPLPASQPHVVFRLRREDEKVPWIVELVFLLFNAQGDILQVARGANTPDTSTTGHRTAGSHAVAYFGEENFRATRAKLKETDEREVVRFSMTKVHPFVEVVGCLVTYAEDEIARSPQLNAFSLTCDLHALDSSQAEAEAQALAAGGKRFVFNDSGEHTRLLNIYHDPKTLRRHIGKQTNVVILCKLFRRHGKHHDWAFHAATEDRSNVVVRSAVTASLVETMQIFLLDLMPDIKIPNRNPLSSVAGICAALTCNEFLGIERHFPKAGLSKVDFTRLLLWELMRARPSLMRHLNRASALIGLLFEMFEQIDINGDSVVDWDEFTSFCIALGLVATRVPHDENDHDQGQSHGDNHDAPPRNMIVYRHEPLSSGTATRTFPYQINKLKNFPQLKRLAVIEHKSPRILFFDLDMSFLHELNCSEKLAAEKKAGEKQQDVLDSLEVLDAEHIPSRNALAVASSDLCISLWSIIDATVGSYVFNGKLAGRFPALFVKWCPPPLKRLFVAGGSTDHVQLWDLEVPMHAGAAPPPPPMLLPRSHTERIAACLDLPETPYVATASFDHTITIWETVAGANSALGGPSAVLTVSFVLRGHQQAVLTLDSAYNLLLSSGFEYQAYCWGISGRVLKTKLGGHHHCLMGAKFVSTSASGPCLVVTGDQSGHFKLWDITRCAKGLSGNHLSIMLQTFELHTPNLCRFRMFMTSSSGATGPESQHDEPGAESTESPACDIVTGNLRLYRFSAFTQSVGSQDDAAVDESAGSAPTRFIVFNAVANTFVGAVENRITVWNANSGAKIEEPVTIRDAEVCAIAFDSPRERKLFVATNDGAIRLYNPVTGALLQKLVVHDGTVTSLVFCSHANCLISTGDDRMVCVVDSPPGKLKLEVIHYVEKAHNSSITCCACSPPPATETHTSRFIATADDAGGVQVHDLHHITFQFRCATVHTREIRALHFPAATPGFLVSGDVSGVIFVWPTIGVRTSIAQPLMRLKMQEITPSRPVSSNVEFDGITAICSTTSHDSHSMLYVGVETGQIFAWDLHSLPVKTQSESTRRSAIRRRSSVSKGEISVLESGGKSAPLPVILSIKSWMAHQAGVLSVQSVSWPGELLSLGADGMVKIWDRTATCVGHILTTAEQSSVSASAWKFIRRDQTPGGHQNDTFERIAREVTAKHQRRLKKELSRQRKSGQQPQNEHTVSDNSLSTSSSLLELDSPAKSPPGLQFTGNAHFPDASIAMTNAANALVALVPFSVTSVTSGVHQGIFGPEEAQHLRAIAKNSKALLLDASDKRKRVAALAPLFASPEEMMRARAKAKAKARATMNNSPQILDFPSRALTNYPLELERRAAANAKAAASALRALDPEPSPFLREKLQDAASPIVKSTPKKRLQRLIATPEIDIKMSASVVILARNVSLPKLTQPPSQDLDDPPPTLSTSASAPVLHVVATDPPSMESPEKKNRSSNIERKLKLCQKIVANVCLMSSKPKVSKVRNEKEKPGSPASNLRQQTLTLAIAQGKNPFGPHYTVKQVEQLAIRLARLDEDGSGDLDQHEWKQLAEFCGLDSNATSIDTLFHSLDRDSDGTISVRELLPSLFRQASTEQLQQMRAFIQTRMIELRGARQ
ncbi:EF hand [Phytophthora infestans]|uniref:EF hand n=1 Tax=Phytophthora infestans TaxID=4787 RepID=A0A8S9TUZ4_PHYIN|nr:EF hand [Phytophthora infestans]